MDQAKIVETDAVCPAVQAAFELIGRKWTALIVKALLVKDRCFAEIERSVPDLSSRMLALRMKELEAAGILTRSVSGESPIRVTYSLTEKGRALGPVVDALEVWARAWPAFDQASVA